MKRENRTSQRFAVAMLAFLLFSIFTAAIRANEEQPIDWQQAETLTENESAYLERAKQQRRQQARGTRPQDEAAPAKETTGLVPITEMASRLYKGQTGGLYGEGRNTPPDSHQAAAIKELAKIQPLDAKGKPSKTGKVVLISLGMSNTTQEFSFFKKLADVDPNKSPSVVIVDCAQGGQAAHEWVFPDERQNKKRPTPWNVMDQRMGKAGVTSAQVQAVWIKQAQKNPAGRLSYTLAVRRFISIF
jgi:hypothetical protein